jgi:chromosomal replication initiation ATPase DnaA
VAVNSINDIWDAVCEECKQKISEIAFDTFFKYLKPESLSGEEFVLSASNDYIKGMIQSVYSDIINDAIEKVMGIKIPEILVSGHHKNIEKWKREQALLVTMKKRPDMLEKAELTDSDKAFLEQFSEKS